MSVLPPGRARLGWERDSVLGRITICLLQGCLRSATTVCIAACSRSVIFTSSSGGVTVEVDSRPAWIVAGSQ